MPHPSIVVAGASSDLRLAPPTDEVPNRFRFDGLVELLGFRFDGLVELLVRRGEQAP